MSRGEIHGLRREGIEQKINGSRRMEHGRGDLCKGKNSRAGLRKELRIMEQEEGKTSIEGLRRGGKNE